jgi:transcription elongation factor Elf1
MNCPHCGAEDSVEVLVDAWAVHEFEGFDDLGQPKVTSNAVRVDEFDDAHAQCQQCGEKVEP